MTPQTVDAYQTLRRLGYSRAQAAEITHIPYAQAWALDRNVTPYRSNTRA